MGFLVSTFTVGINSKSFSGNVHSVQETSPNFLRRPKPVDNTADNADITQSHAASSIESLDTRPRRTQEVNSLCTDSRVFRAEYRIVGIPRNATI